jgi:SAM-dependent methyltransferase
MTGNICVACQSTNVLPWFIKRSAVDGKDYPIVRCAACGSAFVHPRPTAEYLEQYYSGVGSSHAVLVDVASEENSYQKVLSDEAAFPNSSVDAERIARNCRELCKGSRFLDIGAGYGFFSHAALKQGFQVTAIEPTEICRKVFKRMNGFEPLAGMMTDQFAEERPGSFDVILMSQVLEHIQDLENMLQNLSKLLAPGGVIVIAVPHFGSWLSRAQGKGDMFIVTPEHLNFFSSKGLASLFQRHGLHHCKLHTVSRLNVARVARRVPIPLVGNLLSQGLLAAMHLSDSVGGGMFLNAYFRKPSIQ